MDRLLRFSILCAAVIIGAGIVTGTVARPQHASIVAAIGVDIDVLRSGRLYVLPVDALVQAQPGINPAGALFLVLALGACEWLAGSWRTLVAFFGIDILTTFISFGIYSAGAALGSRTLDAYAHTPDLGSSVAVTSCAAMVAVLLPPRLRAVALGGLLAWLIGGALYSGGQVGIEHAVGAAGGVALGLLTRRAQASRARDETVRGIA